LSPFSCACLHDIVLVSILLCLSLLSCACLHSLVLVFILLCLSSFSCACLHNLVLVFILLCLSPFSCACLYSLVLVHKKIFNFLHLPLGFVSDDCRLLFVLRFSVPWRNITRTNSAVCIITMLLRIESEFQIPDSDA
jgi:hypothetical protein